MLKRFIATIVFITLLSASFCNAQESTAYIKERIARLASPDFHGRGYVMGGGNIAAQYIADDFKKSGVLPLRLSDSYFQGYTFSINTFPGEVSLSINGKKLVPGADYITNAASSPWKSEKVVKMKKIDLSKVKDSASWDNVKTKLLAGGSYYLKHADTPTKYMKLGIRNFAKELPKGLFIVPKHGKLIWTANTNQEPATIIYVEDTVLPKRPKKVLAEIETRYFDAFQAKNVLGYVKGTEQPDSFIVFTAHYDHLGRMGKDALFAGASDNASGTAFVMYLANYFARHPQKYSIAFMLFSGEEARLLGSKYYVENPILPLNQIRFLVNMDMVGDATNGFTVVNAVSHEPEFALLEHLNADSTYAKVIKKRERTSNSDHYHFSKEGVPAVFIYGHGINGHYHDVFDLPKDVNLNRVDDMATLLIQFTGKLCDGYKSESDL